MANNIQTFVGNITGDPELRYTQSGVAVANFTVAQSSGHYDRDKGEYVEDNTVFIRVAAWRGLGENVAASLRKGQRVVVIGVLNQSEYEDKDGNKRISFEVQADDVAASHLYGRTEFTKVGRTNREEPGAKRSEEPKATNARGNAKASSKPAAEAAPDDDDDDDF